MTSLSSSRHRDLTAAEQRLQAHPALADTSLCLTLRGDALRLKGEVASHYQKHLAERLVKEFEGLRVSNDVEIERKSLSPFLAERLYRQRLRRLSLNAISAQVEGRTLHLAGQVGSWREREQAEQLALALPGIHAVVNSIRLKKEWFYAVPNPV